MTWDIFLCSPDLDSTCSIEMVNDCREVWWGKLKKKRKNNHTRKTQLAPARKKEVCKPLGEMHRHLEWGCGSGWWSPEAPRPAEWGSAGAPTSPPSCHSPQQPVCANGSWLRLNRERTNTTAVEPLSSPAYCRSNGPSSCAAGPIWPPLCFHKQWPAGDGCTEERRRRDEGSDLNFKGWGQTDLPVCTLQGRGAVVFCGKSYGIL